MNNNGKSLLQVRPDPGKNRLDVKELFHKGEPDPQIEKQMTSRVGKMLLMTIVEAGYPLIKVAKKGASIAVKASAPDGRFIMAESADENASVLGALTQIVKALEGK